ncbi:probable glycosyltransferase At5g03795 isoform X1 [Actinidia eriantha]|uniref:probable glycosyltransferase At5g03795 isoform X1 n=2 Tax=Actinidia eriantha TaxID=165200 RepID=UPI0025885B31|nr:probable glycosyltransferase At5g03795 isoform X1 [Actinidia eriantha]
MGDCKRRLCSWWSSSSSSSSWLPFLMVPLILVSGSMALMGSKTSNWFLIFPNSWLWRSSATIASANSTSTSIKEQNMTHEQQVGEKVGISNNTLDGPHIDPNYMKTNDSMPVISEVRSQKEYSNLERLEAGLGCARAAIREATNENDTNDPDYTPTGPMYWNATAFHRSYIEMEKQLKVFVYEEGDPPVFHYGPCKHTYAIEGLFIQSMEISQFRTSDPDKAQLYFLPFSVTMITQVVYVVDSHDWDSMKNTAKDYVNVISQKYPYWNRSLGADHFMLACHDWGPEISFAVPNLYNNSIRALCNANTSEKFNPSRDVSVPEIHLPAGTTAGLLGGPSPSKRSILVFYAGGVHGPIRPILLDHWENKDPEVQVHKYLPSGLSYYGMMRKSKYCICPSGYEVASPRMVEALYMGCVPVLIKANYVIPFSDVLNWKAFSVIVPVEDIPNLKKILVGISKNQYLRMQRRGKQMRRHFEVNSPPKRFDVFHMILHSIWLRRLNIRIHDI